MTRQGGFTLMEMLLAMALLGLLSVALFGGLRFLSHDEKKIAAIVADAEDYSLLRDVLTRQTGAAFPLTAQGAGGSVPLFSGLADRIAFPILRLPGQGAAGLTLAVFDIVSADGVQKLIYREYEFEAGPRINVRDQPTRSTQLAQSSGPMQFRFRDRQGQWLDRWKDGAQMPRLIGFVSSLGPEILVRPIAEPGSP